MSHNVGPQIKCQTIIAICAKNTATYTLPDPNILMLPRELTTIPKQYPTQTFFQRKTTSPPLSFEFPQLTTKFVFNHSAFVDQKQPTLSINDSEFCLKVNRYVGV
jgi:hypothetical protein